MPEQEAVFTHSKEFAQLAPQLAAMAEEYGCSMIAQFPDRSIAAWNPAIPFPTQRTPQNIAIGETFHPRRKRGRPPGSGTYASADDFRQAIGPIIHALRRQGIHPSTERVAKLLPTKTTDRQMRRWIRKHLKMPWEDFIKAV